MATEDTKKGPSTAFIRMDRSGVKEVRDILEQHQISLKDCSRLFQDIVDDVYVPSAAKTFDQGGRPVRWRDLKEEYALRKAVLVGHTQILVYSGDLRESVATDKGNAYTIREVGPRRVLFGSSLPYAAAHQYGYPKGNIPARPFIVVQDEDYEKILDMTIDWVGRVGIYEGFNG